MLFLTTTQTQSVDTFLNYDLLSMYEPVSIEFQILPIRRLIVCALSAIIWETIYQICRKGQYKYDIHTASKLTAFVHSVYECICVPIVLYKYYYNELSVIPPTNTFCDPIKNGEYLLCMSCGYFLWDLFYLTTNYFNGIDKIWFVHCFLCLCVYFPALFVPYMQRQSILVLLFETSTVFYYLFEYFDDNTNHDTDLYYYYYGYFSLVCKVLFSLTFILTRLMLGSLMLFEVWDSTYPFLQFYYTNHSNCVPLLCKGPISICILFFQILNFYWFANIVKQYYYYICASETTKTLAQKQKAL